MKPDSGAGHRDIQGLLPWWANGTLDLADRRRVEAHLEHCTACQREAVLLTRLEEALDEAAAVGLVEAPHAPSGRSYRPALPWLGWAAAAVLALALGLETGVVPGLGNGEGPALDDTPVTATGSTGVIPTYRLDAVRRSSADTVVIPADAGTDFQLLLHVDLGPGAFPLELALEDSEHHTVLRQTEIGSLYEGRFLFIHCAASDVPPGRYLALLRGHGPEAPAEPLRYSFRVVAPARAPHGKSGEGREGP